MSLSASSSRHLRLSDACICAFTGALIGAFDISLGLSQSDISLSTNEWLRLGVFAILIGAVACVLIGMSLVFIIRRVHRWIPSSKRPSLPGQASLPGFF